MSLLYNFAFAPPAAGETVTITDDGGNEIDTATVGSTVGTDGAVMAQVELSEGGYIGTVTGDFGTWSTRGLLDEPDSIEAAANQPGASETAHFIATETAGTDEESTATLIVKPGTDAAEWAPLVDGQIELDPETAGGCYAQIVAQSDLDYTATDAPTGAIGVFYELKRNGSNVLGLPPEIDETGDGEIDSFTLDAIPIAAATVSGGTLAAVATSFGDIDDGVATHKFGVTLTRFAPAPTLP